MIRTTCLLTALLLVPTLALGQAAVTTLPPPAPPSPVIGVVEVPPSDPLLTLAGDPAPRGGQQFGYAVSLVGGQPTVIRVAAKVLPRENNSVWLEAYFGPVLLETMYGFGARIQHTGREFGNGDRIMFAPGLGVQILPSGGGRYFLAGDVDISWLHEFGPRCAIDLGFKLGVAGKLGGTPVNDDLSRIGMFSQNFYPLVGLFSGLRF